MSLAESRRCVTYLKTEYAISERHACQAMQLNRSSYRYVASQELIDESYREGVSLSQPLSVLGLSQDLCADERATDGDQP